LQIFHRGPAKRTENGGPIERGPGKRPRPRPLGPQRFDPGQVAWFLFLVRWCSRRKGNCSSGNNILGPIAGAQQQLHSASRKTQSSKNQKQTKGK